MKKLLVSVLCVLLLLGTTSALAATVTATGDVYLRTGPGLNYATIVALERGDTASYLGNLAVDDRGVTWYKVFYADHTGWVSSRYSELDTWSWSYGYITATGDVWVRSGPGLDYAKLGAIEKGDTLEYKNETSVDGRGVTWYKVSYGVYGSAWISSKYSTVYGYSPSSKTVTATGSVNVRAGASTTYDSLATMFKGDTAAYLDASTTDYRGVVWYKVNYGGVIGWVSSVYASLYGSSSSSSSGGGWSYGTLTVTGNAWIRTGPGLDYDKITDVTKGTTMSYLGNSSVDGRGVTWYKVSYNGNTGWISSRYSYVN